MILIEEIAWQFAHVLAVLELGSSDLTRLFEITVFIKSLMNFVLDFSFKIKFLEKSRNHLTYLLCFSLSIPHNFFFDSLFNAPKDIAVLDFLED